MKRTCGAPAEAATSPITAPSTPTLRVAAMTASGSVITENVPEAALALGRARQVNKPGLARKLFEKFKTNQGKQQKVMG